MSTTERFQAEPPPPPPAPGMSTGSKILLGCGIGCGVLALLCCGGVAVVVWFGYETFNRAVDKDPAHVRTMTAELATIDVPAGLEPKAAIDFRVPIVDRNLFKLVAYAGPNDDQVFALGEFSSAFGAVDQSKLRDEIDRALSQHEVRAEADDFLPDEAEKHTLELEIRGQPAKFLIEAGEMRSKRKKMIRAMGQFEGHDGTALLFLQLDAEQHDMDQVEQILRSIR